MKLTVCLSVQLMALLAFPASVFAAAPEAADGNPYAGMDPDGVPLSVTQNVDTTAKKLSPEAKAIMAKEQADLDARANNWLLIEYEDRFKHNGASSQPDQQTMSMYLQLSMNKDLTQVVGEALTDRRSPDASPSLRATSGPSAQNSMALRPDATPAKPSFTPLISALSSPAATSASQPFYASAYSASLPQSLSPIGSLDGATPSAPVPAPKPSLSMPTPSPTDTIDMQTPGEIADKSNPLPGAPDLSLDSLPQQQPNDQPPILPELPQAMDSSTLHQEQNVKLQGPKATLAKNKQQQNAQQPQAAKPIEPPPPEAPAPISQQPQISPVHAPLPNPFDILNH